MGPRRPARGEERTATVSVLVASPRRLLPLEAGVLACGSTAVASPISGVESLSAFSLGDGVVGTASRRPAFGEDGWGLASVASSFTWRPFPSVVDAVDSDPAASTVASLARGGRALGTGEGMVSLPSSLSWRPLASVVDPVDSDLAASTVASIARGGRALAIPGVTGRLANEAAGTLKEVKPCRVAKAAGSLGEAASLRFRTASGTFSI